MGKPHTATVVAEPPTPATSKPDYTRLSATEIKLLFELRKEGMTQTAIAQRLGCSQRTVSEWLTDCEDTTDVANLYLRGKALSMAKNVVENGQARDHIQALKGVGVLERDGADIKIAIGLSLPGLPIESARATPVVTVSPIASEANG
jgi:orotate phosphoribosyltransferase-like protein